MLRRPVSVEGRHATRGGNVGPAGSERLTLGEHVPDGSGQFAGDVDASDLGPALATEALLVPLVAVLVDRFRPRLLGSEPRGGSHRRRAWEPGLQREAPTGALHRTGVPTQCHRHRSSTARPCGFSSPRARALPACQALLAKPGPPPRQSCCQSCDMSGCRRPRDLSGVAAPRTRDLPQEGCCVEDSRSSRLEGGTPCLLALQARVLTAWPRSGICPVSRSSPDSRSSSAVKTVLTPDSCSS
jgi:hypothetical protein